VLGVLALVLGFMSLTATTASADEVEQVCEALDTGHIDPSGEPTEITITAPEGMLIDAVCVKAGSVNNENGPVVIVYDPPMAEVTFIYPGGKAISHYSVSYVPVPTDTPTVPTDTPTVPTDTPTVPTDTPTVTDTPTEPVDTPTDVTVLPSETEPPNGTDTPTVLPTEVDAGINGTSGGNTWALPLIGAGLALLVMAVALVVRRPRGTHQF